METMMAATVRAAYPAAEVCAPKCVQGVYALAPPKIDGDLVSDADLGKHEL